MTMITKRKKKDFGDLVVVLNIGIVHIAYWNCVCSSIISRLLYFGNEETSLCV